MNVGDINMRASIRTAFVAVAAILLAFAAASPAPAASFLWRKQLGGPNFDQVNFLRGDAAGNIVIAYAYAVADVDGSWPLTYAVIKYDPSGKKLWQRNQSGDFLGLALDPSGNVYAIVQTPASGPVLVKYTADGALVWRQPSKVSNYAWTGGITGFAVDNAGRAILASASCYSGSCPTIGLIAYTSAGSVRWAKKLIDGAYEVQTAGVAFDLQGNVIIAGTKSTQDYIDNDEVWIAKLTNGGSLTFLNVFDDHSLASMGTVYGGRSVGNGVATDSAGDIVIGGWAAYDLVGQPARCGAAHCAFVAKFDPNGAPLWTNVLKVPLPYGGLDSQVSVVTIGPLDEIVVAGLRNVWRSQNSQLYTRPWVASFAADGTQLWSWYWPIGTIDDFGAWPAGVAVDALGNVAFGGWTSGPLAGSWKGYSDGFVAKLKP